MSTKKFNPSNPESLIYENDLLKITVLGGIKLEGLDRMRSTLKIELKNTSVPPVRHNLDLYNDSQCEKLIRKTAEKLETGTSIIAASLSELTESLEVYRLERVQETQPQPLQTPKLSKEEKEAALSLLTAKDLLLITNNYIGKSGIVGEENNRLLMYLIFTSRKREQPLHIVSLASSGTGKTHLQEGVAKLIPDEDKIELTTLSENAFYYFGQRELKNKLILIEDLDGAENVLYPLRELQSKKKISKTIAHKSTNGETKTMHLVVEGPVSVAGCTTKEQIYEDNANRSFLIYLDESQQQDNRIMEYQRLRSAGKVNTAEEHQAAELLCNVQRLLEPIRVVNPYAKDLIIPKEVLKPRRTNNHYLQFIEAVTFYHQHQREQKVDEITGELYIETTLEDIKNANQLLKDILLRKSDDLTGACRNYFEKLKLYLIGRKDNNSQPGSGFTNREMSLKLRIPISTVKRHHYDLYNCGYLRVSKKDKLKGYEYEIVSYEEYKQLQAGITGVLEESLKRLSASDQPSSPKAAQQENEPLKPQKTKRVSKAAQ
ncbi:hypothetical protein CRYO30217_01585 [Parvicella tangerina]|uniref:DNA primase n=2 Tax=Parvicella tangerina TaxID=2829795 RepID=A0A916JMZ3_9FLAO|nr:hypothetical protein CRYO30217_01585 [Parvicella tangerina]